MVALLSELTTGEGLLPTCLDGVRLGRADRAVPRAPVEAEILGPGIVREIVYRALCGPRGHLLLEMVGRQGHAAQINAALRWMHSRYAEPFSVARMAAEVGMSVSAFHHQFKALTTSSPVQYLKSVRLHKARALIVEEGIGAASAASAVGYESASQFSREFKRVFGTSPNELARQVRVFAARPVPSRVAEARAS
ncbi:MAG TPA: helix-turn-helix domain-containing protein [Vicinamibacterales bacterium]